MAKKVTAQVKLQIPAGKATPAPPVGTALGPQGVNIMDFCKAFNAKTSAKDQEGLIIPVVITIFSDRSFTFITKTPPVPVLIKRAVNLAKGSAEPHKTKVGKITHKQVEEIAKIKMPDLNCFDLEAAMRSVQAEPPAVWASTSYNIFSCFVIVRMWRNWQTRMVQVHVPARVWRFKSSHPHQSY